MNVLTLPYLTKSTHGADFGLRMRGSVKSVDTTGRAIEGYGSAFGVVDADLDVIEPGAYLASLSDPSHRPRIRFLHQHNHREVLGTLDVLKEDSRGLFFRTTLAETRLADDVLALYRSGAYTEHSVGFRVLDSRPGTVDGQRVTLITKILLYEISVVTWGANPETPPTRIGGVATGKRAAPPVIDLGLPTRTRYCKPPRISLID